MTKVKKQIRTCVDCGCKFEDYPPAKRCKPCKDANYKRLIASRPRKTERKAPTRTVVCAQCGTSFCGGNSSKYCTSCAVDRIAVYDRKKNAQHQERYKAEGWPRVCAMCRKSFTSQVSSRKYCDDCNQHKPMRKPRSDIGKSRQSRQQFNADACIYERNRFNGDVVYKACIRLDGKQIHLGYFPTREEAKKARIIAYEAKCKVQKEEETP